MKLDCYAVLGLSPAADDVVIRAAYLALMRSYHPDRNPSPEAAARTRAITEAYKTIGDPARRAEYDASRQAFQYQILGYDGEGDELEPQPRLWRKAPAIQWLGAPVVGLVAASAMAIVLAVLALPLGEDGRVDTAVPRISPPAAGKVVAAPPPLVTAASAAETKPLPEPPAGIPAEAKKAPATWTEPARASAAKPLPARVEVPRKPMRTAEASTPPPAPAPSKPAPVDEKARVATLESMSTSFYNQSISRADDGRRSQLQQARNLFVSARNACQSDKCVGDAHASYIGEISRIMKKANQANP